MSVLQRDELEASPLADLHAVASELAIEGYRALRKEDLIAAILQDEGGDGPAAKDEGSDDPVAEDSGSGRQTSGRRARSRSRSRSKPKAQGSEGSGEGSDEAGDPEPDGDFSDSGDGAPSGEPVAGTLDILPNGSGFIRVGDAPAADVYISPAQIRRCELRAGDEVGGASRPARRNERHPSLVRVEQVNGRDAEPPEERPHFDDLTPVHPSEVLPVPDAIKSVSIGKGSRVAVAGGPGTGATRLLRELVSGLSGAGELSVSVVLVGARPEEVTDWTREADVAVTGGSFDRSTEVQAQAAELAVERAKRVAERGGDAVVVVDSLEMLASGVARRVFGAARKLEEGGSVTVVAATGMSWEAQRQASTRIGLDPPSKKGEPQVAEARSGTLRADLLA